VALAACSGAAPSASPVASAPASAAASSGASASGSAASPAASIDNAEFIVAWSSTPDEKYLPYLMAIDHLKQQGYNISGKQLANDDILYQGLASYTVQAGMGGASQVANAVNAGVPIKIVASRSATDAVYVAEDAYKDCKSLDGQPVGIFSPQAILTLFMNEYFKQNCPGIKYTPVTIADSGLRAQAMEHGQIHATVLGLADAITLDAANPGKFFMVAFGQTMPGVGDAYLVATTKALSEHRSIVDAWVKENLVQTRALYAADDATLTSLEKQYFPSAKDASVLKSLIKDKLWYANGGLGGDGLEKTLQLFSLPGSRATLIDDGPMTNALGALGNSTATDH
jgi:hypothetical protein